MRLLLVGSLALLAARLVWVAVGTETGWETIAGHWRDAALSPVGLKPTFVGLMEPAEQADFWLPEVDRVLSQHPDSAEHCNGAI